MSSKWVFIDSKRIRDKNVLTPPPEVRELVVGEHKYHDRCVYWYYDDEETGLAVVSNQKGLDFVSFGYSKVHDDNAIVPDSGMVEAAFGGIEAGDSIIFLGEKGIYDQDIRILYFIHEDQIYNMISYPKEV